jgi:integrase
MQLVGRPKLKKPLPKALPRTAVEALLSAVAQESDTCRTDCVTPMPRARHLECQRLYLMKHLGHKSMTTSQRYVTAAVSKPEVLQPRISCTR